MEEIDWFDPDKEILTPCYIFELPFDTARALCEIGEPTFILGKGCYLPIYVELFLIVTILVMTVLYVINDKLYNFNKSLPLLKLVQIRQFQEAWDPLFFHFYQ